MTESSSSNPSDDAVSGLLENVRGQKATGLDSFKEISSCPLPLSWPPQNDSNMFPTACSASVHLLEKHRLLGQLYCRAMQYSNIFNMHFFLKQHTQLPTLISHASCRASEWSPAPAAFHRPKEVAVVEALCSPCQGLDWEKCTNELTSNSLAMSCDVLAPLLGSRRAQDHSPLTSTALGVPQLMANTGLKWMAGYFKPDATFPRNLAKQKLFAIWRGFICISLKFRTWEARKLGWHQVIAKGPAQLLTKP